MPRPLPRVFTLRIRKYMNYFERMHEPDRGILSQPKVNTLQLKELTVKEE